MPQAKSKHNTLRRSGALKPSNIEKLIAAHKRARARHEKAIVAATQRQILYAKIDLPEILGDKSVSSHGEIDMRCEAYVEEARKNGFWAARHHCTDANPIMMAPPKETRLFTRESLKEYRARVQAHHAKLDKANAELEQVNVSSGARALHDRETAAMKQVNDAWLAFRRALPKMSPRDIARFARYVLLYTSNELNVTLTRHWKGHLDLASTLFDNNSRDALRWISDALKPAGGRVRRAA